MFCCIRQVRVPFIHPYLPLKCTSLRTQSYSKVHEEQFSHMPFETDGYPTTHGTLQDDSWNMSLPHNVNSASMVTEVMEDCRQFLPLYLSSIPQRTKTQRKLSTQRSILNEINKFSMIRHDVAVSLEVQGNSQKYFLYTNQDQRLSPGTNAIPSANQSTIWYSDGSKPIKEKASNGKPTEAQLVQLQEALIESMLTFFLRSHNYSLYNTNLVFHNNISGVTTRGIQAYSKHLSMVRVLAMLKYTHVKMHVLKVTNHTEDGTVRVRWRVSGVPGLKALFMFWKFRPSTVKDMKEAEWTDGFSVFSVGSDGLIYKHVCDKIMPDDNVQKVSTGSLGIKFAAGLGFLSNGEYLPL